MRLFNSLTRQIEEFEPIKSPSVGMYTCGPTVYSYATIGNWRTYTFADLLLRVLKYMGYDVDYVMNITDVGHLTGDNLGDADLGEDRLEKAAVKEGRSAWEIAKFYTDDFYQGFDQLNLIQPRVWCKATDHIKEQIELIQKIEAHGLTYKIDDGIYFDTRKYDAAGNKYGELSTLDTIKAGARVEENKQKHDSRDFALWKLSPPASRRQMEWESPWGVGFPGWHIECSAMSMKYLGEQFDVHVGGEDLRSTHHPNEIAQAEAATGKKPFVKYWLHGAFLLVDGGRMGKSLGNAYTLMDLAKKGNPAVALRYFYLTGHYRSPQNFTWEALQAAQTAYQKLTRVMGEFYRERERNSLSEEKLAKLNVYRERFREAVAEDLNLPAALAIVWEVVKSNVPSTDKYDLIREFDEVLGLKLDKVAQVAKVAQVVQDLIKERERLRKAGEYGRADEIRKQIEAQGYKLEDTPAGTKAWKTDGQL